MRRGEVTWWQMPVMNKLLKHSERRSHLHGLDAAVIMTCFGSSVGLRVQEVEGTGR